MPAAIAGATGAPATAPGRAASPARRGVTLIEAVLFIAVALGLIVGGLVFYQQASRAATHQAVVRQLQVVQGEVRALYQVSKWQNTAGEPLTNLSVPLINMGAVPREMVSGNQIRLRYGGQLVVQHRMQDRANARVMQTHFQLQYRLDDVPEWLRTRLVVAKSARGILNDGRRNRTGIIDIGNGVISDIVEIDFHLPSAGPPSRSHRFHNRATPPEIRPGDTSGDLTPAIAARHCRDMRRADGTIERITFRTLPPV